MFKCLFTVYPVVRAYLQTFFYQVCEQGVILKDLLYFLKSYHILIVLNAILIYRPIKEWFPYVTFSRFCNHPMRKFPTVLLYHTQMLDVLVCGKQQLSCEQLAYYATYRPYITFFVPHTTLHNNFWRSILPGVYDGTVIVVVLGGTSKVDDSDWLAVGEVVVIRRIYFFWVAFSQSIVFQQNVFRL